MNKWTREVLLPDLLKKQQESGKGFIYLSSRQAEFIEPYMKQVTSGCFGSTRFHKKTEWNSPDGIRTLCLQTESRKARTLYRFSIGKTESEQKALSDLDRRKHAEHDRERLIKWREKHPERFAAETEKLKDELDNFREYLEDAEIERDERSAELYRARIAELEYILDI